MSEFDRDQGCLRRMVAGDTAGLSELYDRHCDALCSLVARVLGGPADLEAVLQESWLLAWRTANSYDPARGAVAAWLMNTARGCALDRVRALGARGRGESTVGAEAVAEPPRRAPDPATGFARRMLREDVAAALAALTPQQRQALELAYFDGLPPAEIARRIGVPLGTVRSSIRQALLKLRERVPTEELP